MKRPLRILIRVLGVIAFLAVLAVIVAKFVFTKARILALLSPRIEAMIHRPVQIGDAAITFWGGIGVQVTDLTVGNRPGFSETPFLRVADVSVKARFWPLLFGRVEIDHVHVDRPAVLLEYDASGGSNLDGLLSRSPEPAATGSMESDTAPSPNVLLQHLIITDGRLALRDARVPRQLDATGLDMDLRLSTGAPPMARLFAIGLSFDSLAIVQKEHRWLIAGGTPRCFISGEWDRNGGSIRGDSVALSWWGVTVIAQGSIHSNPGLREIDLSARLLPMQVQDILPEIQRLHPIPFLAGLEASAQGSVEASFVWPLPGGRVPEWRANLDLSDLRWLLPGKAIPLTVSRIELRGSGQSLSWTANGGRFADGDFSTSGTIDQMFTGERTLSGRVQADMPVSGLEAFLPHSRGLSLDGRINADITGFSGLGMWQTARFTGHVASDHLTAADTSWTVDSVSAAFDLGIEGTDLVFRRCDWRAGSSQGSLGGRVNGLLPALLSGFKSPDVPRAELTATCGRLDLDELVGEEAPPFDSAAATRVPVPVPPVVATGNLSGDTVIYSGLVLTQVHSPFQLKSGVFTLAPIEGNVLGGRLRGSLLWDISTWPDPSFSTSLRADSIEANDLLARYFGWAGGVFGQAVLQGEFSGRGRYARDILPRLIASGSVEVASGRMEATPLLAKIGEQIGVRGLDRPRSIRDLGMPFRVANGRIITDPLRFSTDDAQYTAVGSLGFDRTLDYQVKIVPRESKGMPRSLTQAGLRFHLTGTVSEPVVRVDVREAGQAVMKSLLDAAGDSLKSGIDKVLKDLLKPHKP
jgi:hypothetical protein